MPLNRNGRQRYISAKNIIKHISFKNHFFLARRNFFATFFALVQRTLAQDYRINDRTQVFIEETACDLLMIKFYKDYPAPVSVNLNW